MEKLMGPSWPNFLTPSPLPWLRLGTLEQKLQREEKTVKSPSFLHLAVTGVSLAQALWRDTD